MIRTIADLHYMQADELLMQQYVVISTYEN